MTNGFFITGTDTGIGKTTVCRLLYEAFSKKTKTEYVKPVQTGCLKNKYGGLTAPDYDTVVKGGVSDDETPKKNVPFRYEPECSPHLAAELSKSKISKENILESIEAVSEKNSITIVEGAGGLYVPVNKNYYMIDLIAETGLPVILVTSPGLGTLNHTFMSINALRNRNIETAAVVFNNYQNMEENYIYTDNRDMIRQYCFPSLFCEIKYGQKPDNFIKDFCDEIGKRFIG